MTPAYFIRAFWLSIAFTFPRGVLGADCTCSGLDYTNGGSYLIDGTSDSHFVFTSEFLDCGNGTVQPILVAPEGIQVPCSTINSGQGGQQQSTCGVELSAMSSGQWTIVIQADNSDFAVQRRFTLTIGSPEKTVVTVTPTISVGVTSTPQASTITTTTTNVHTVYAQAPDVAGRCDQGQDETVTQYIEGPTATVLLTYTRLSTTGVLSLAYATTVVLDAQCHYQSQPLAPQVDSPPPVPQNAIPQGCSDCRPWFGKGGWGWEHGRGDGGGLVPGQNGAGSGGPGSGGRPGDNGGGSAGGGKGSPGGSGVGRPRKGEGGGADNGGGRPAGGGSSGGGHGGHGEGGAGGKAGGSGTGDGSGRGRPGGAAGGNPGGGERGRPGGGNGGGGGEGGGGRSGGGGGHSGGSSGGGGGHSGGAGGGSRGGGSGGSGGRPGGTGGGNGGRGGGGSGGSRGGGSSGGSSGRGGGGSGGSRGGGSRGGRGGHDTGTPAIVQRAPVAVAASTSTVYETTYTVTRTVTTTALAPTMTEAYYVGSTLTITPDAQTVCNPDDAKTVIYEAEETTETHVETIALNTLATVWVGQTQYSTQTDWGAASACWQGGGWYGL